MKAFVSGGAGVIGRELVALLRARGDYVIVGDLQPRPEEFGEGVEYIQGDLNDLKEFPSCDVFYHLAATFERLEESPEHFEKNFQHNVRLSHHLLSLCPTNVRVVFASSYLVYTGRDIEPRNLTGAAKFYTESEIMSRFDEYSIGRIYRSYGKGSRDVISRWIRAGLRGEEIEVYNADSQYDYIYAGDVARILDRLPYGTHDVCTGNHEIVYNVALIIKDAIPELKIKFDRKRRGAKEICYSEIQGWGATDLVDGIQKVVEYERGKL